METRLTFEYDAVGDILYINKVKPYAEQESEELEYNIVVRRNPRTDAVENLEILFFTRWLLQDSPLKANNLIELFAERPLVEKES